MLFSPDPVALVNGAAQRALTGLADRLRELADAARTVDRTAAQAARDRLREDAATFAAAIVESRSTAVLVDRRTVRGRLNRSRTLRAMRRCAYLGDVVTDVVLLADVTYPLIRHTPAREHPIPVILERCATVLDELAAGCQQERGTGLDQMPEASPQLLAAVLEGFRNHVTAMETVSDSDAHGPAADERQPCPLSTKLAEAIAAANEPPDPVGDLSGPWWHAGFRAQLVAQRIGCN